MNEPVTITIPDTRAPSWNDFWAGRHWSKRRAEAERMALLVRAAVDIDACTVYTVPVAVTVTATYKSRPVDCENICVKPATDALIGLLLVDDDPRLRIVLAGYDTEHVMPDAWRVASWTAIGGYSKRGSASQANRHRERLWLSPHCLRDDRPNLFGD